MPSFMRYISIITRCAIQYRGERLAPCGLNGSHIEYILTICRNPGITQDQLARDIHVNGSNVTRQLTLLEANGFVARRPCPTDRRMTEVYPTQKALESLPFVREVLHRWNEYLTDGFTDAEKDCLTGLLARIVTRAESFSENLPAPDVDAKQETCAGETPLSPDADAKQEGQAAR